MKPAPNETGKEESLNDGTEGHESVTQPFSIVNSLLLKYTYQSVVPKLGEKGARLEEFSEERKNRRKYDRVKKKRKGSHSPTRQRIKERITAFSTRKRSMVNLL